MSEVGVFGPQLCMAVVITDWVIGNILADNEMMRTQRIYVLYMYHIYIYIYIYIYTYTHTHTRARASLSCATTGVSMDS